MGGVSLYVGYDIKMITHFISRKKNGQDSCQCLFNGKSTPCGLFNAETWFISKYLIIINTVLWFQIFLSNTNNLHTVI